MRAMGRAQRQKLNDSLRVSLAPAAAAKPAIALFREEVEAARLSVFREEPELPATLLLFRLEQPAGDEESRAMQKYAPSTELRVLHVSGDEFVYSAAELPAFLAGLVGQETCRTVLLLETVRDRIEALRYIGAGGAITLAQAEEALFDLSFARGVDHEFTDTPAQSLTHLLALLNAFSRLGKPCGTAFAFDAARPADDSKARLLGLHVEEERMFARMLCVLPGMSEERAAAIIARYPTLRLLRMGYEGAGSEEARERLLEGIGCAALTERDTAGEKRALGRALSRRVHLFLNSSLRQELL